MIGIKNKDSLKSNSITVAILAVVYIIISILTNCPNFIEQYYSEGLYPLICKIMHPILNVFPFSVGDVFYIGLIIYMLYAVGKLVKLTYTKKLRLLGIYVLKLIIIFEVIIIAFYMLWGLNYFRPSAAKRLHLQDTSYTIADFEAVTSMLIDSANASRALVTISDLNQSNDSIYHTAVVAIKSLGSSPGFKSYYPGIKPSMLSFAMNYLGTSGDYNPFTSESQINHQIPVFVKPVTACHELSHQMGFALEDEADFVGFVAGVSSHNRLLRYSAYYLGVGEFLYALSRKDSVAYKQLKINLSGTVVNDFKVEHAYWKSFEGKAGTLSSIFYDHFLKANNQPQGLKTYNRMIRLTMAWYLKKASDKLSHNSQFSKL